MWNGYLRLGGNEIVNTPRVVALASSLGLPLGVECDECPGLADMAGAVYGDDEAFGDVTTAPWYDENDPASADFIGFVGIRIRDTLDSTREASVIQRLGGGGVIGRSRNATRDVRVTGLLIGRTRLAADYGMSWLSSALDRNACGQHGDTCGLADLEWLADCPPVQGAETDSDYAAAVAPLRRLLHDVAATSGPLALEERETDCFLIYEVEFTITAQEPKVYGAPKDFDLVPSYIDGKTDVVRNLIRNPSLEGRNTDPALSGVYIVSNCVTNPSLEVSTLGWNAVAFTPEGERLVSVFDGVISRESSLRAPVGDYFGVVRGTLETDTTTVVRAGAAIQLYFGPSFEKNNYRGRPLRAGVSVRRGFSANVGMQLMSIDSSGGVLSQTTHYLEYVANNQFIDYLMPESHVVHEDMDNVFLFIFEEKRVSSTNPTSIQAISFDAAWAMIG